MLGKTIANKYRITAQVGVGGMGSVYRAEHKVLGRQSALKVLHTQLNNDKTFIERFMREARAMARLDHDNIVRIYDVFEEDNMHYIAMELFEGPSLKTIIEQHGTLPLEQCVSIISQCARGLAYAHAQGIVHRDIKPSNIMLNSEGRIKITDFGIAAAMDDAATLTNTGQLVGTPRYMSPEQAKNGNIDRRSDLYSLGIVFYELVTGRTPFEGDSGVAIIGKLAYESDELDLNFGSNVPKDMQELIRKMLLRHQDERVQHATHLMGELNKLSIKPENVDHTVTSTLSLTPMQQVHDEKPDKTVFLSKPEQDDASANGVSGSDRAILAAMPPVKTRGRSASILGLVAVLVVSVLIGLFYYKADDDLDENRLGSMPNEAESPLAISVQKSLYRLLEKKTRTETDKRHAMEVGAASIAGVKFGEASDKFLIAEGAIKAIERDIKNKNYVNAKTSIERAGRMFDLASTIFREARDQALAGISSDIFAQVDKLKKQINATAQKIKKSKLSADLKKNYEKAVALTKQASDEYAQAKQYFEDANIEKTKSVLNKVEQGLLEAQTLYDNLVDYVQGQDTINKVYALKTKLSRLRLKILSNKEKADTINAQDLAPSAYNTATSLHSQLAERTNEANFLLRNREYQIASKQFEDLLQFAAKVDDGFVRSTRLAKKKMQQKQTVATIETNNRPVVPPHRPSQSDVVDVERILRDFKNAYESRDIDQLKSIVELSPMRLEATKAIFDKYTEIKLSITSYSLVSGGATANIRIDKVVTAAGDNVVPGKKWRDSTLELIQDGNGGRKVVWR